MLRQTAASTTTVGGDEKHAVCSQPSADISLVIHSFIFIPFLFAPRKSQVTLRVVIWKLILDKRAKGKGERGRFQSCWSNSGDFCFFFFYSNPLMTIWPWPMTIDVIWGVINSMPEAIICCMCKMCMIWIGIIPSNSYHLPREQNNQIECENRNSVSQLCEVVKWTTMHFYSLNLYLFIFSCCCCLVVFCVIFHYSIQSQTITNKLPTSLCI